MWSVSSDNSNSLCAISYLLKMSGSLLHLTWISSIYWSPSSMKFWMRDSIPLATLRCLISCVRRVVSMMYGSTADVVSGSMVRLEAAKCWWHREISLVVESFRYSPWKSGTRFLPKVADWSVEVEFKLCRTSVSFYGDVTVSAAFPLLANCLIWRGFYSRNQIFAAPKKTVILNVYPVYEDQIYVASFVIISVHGGPILCRLVWHEEHIATNRVLVCQYLLVH